MRPSPFLRHALEMQKVAKKNHPLDRLKERAPGVSPDLLPALEQFANSQDLNMEKTYHSRLPGGAYAVLGPVGKKHPKHVVKTVLSPSMSPPGTRLPAPPTTGHVYVTGVSGVGKTTYAKELSKDLGLPLVSLDGVAARASRKWANTSDARKFIAKNLDTPHVIEGTQIMGFKPAELRGHRVVLMEQPKQVIVDRLVRRGWTNAAGELRKGEGVRVRAGEFHDRLAAHADRFKSKVKPEVLTPRIKKAGLFTIDLAELRGLRTKAAALMYAVGNHDKALEAGRALKSPTVFTAQGVKKVRKPGQKVYALRWPRAA